MAEQAEDVLEPGAPIAPEQVPEVVRQLYARVVYLGDEVTRVQNWNEAMFSQHNAAQNVKFLAVVKTLHDRLGVQPTEIAKNIAFLSPFSNPQSTGPIYAEQTERAMRSLVECSLPDPFEPSEVDAELERIKKQAARENA